MAAVQSAQAQRLQAETLRTGGRANPAVRALRKAARSLVLFQKRLRTRMARRQIRAAERTALGENARGVRADLVALRTAG